MTSRTTAKATICRKKWTRAPPTLASGSTARGNLTLPTSEAFDVIETVAVIMLDEISVQIEQAAQHPDGEAGEPGAEDGEHGGVDDEQEQRLEHRPREPEHRVLVAHRQLLADEHDEQLAVAEDLADVGERRAPARHRPQFGGTRGRGSDVDHGGD